MIPKHAQDLLDEIKKLGHKPRGRDAGLIENVKRCIAKNKILTSGQAEWLTDIYRRAAGGGDHQQKDVI